MRALLLDVGNTRLKWGIADDGEIHKTGSITRDKLSESGMSVLTTRLPQHVDAALASNVGGNTIATRLAGLVGAHCGCDLHFARAERSRFGLVNGYAQPRRMGVDRWVAMLGAWLELQSACVVVDAGTAVTIDAIDGDGHHLGGMILPGEALMHRSLSRDTSDIPAVKPAKADAFAGLDMFGTNTRSAVGSGALHAVAGAVDRAIRTLRSNAYDATVVLTGGDASRILAALDEEPLHRPNLVLQGLAEMLERR
ncbi:MAG: type III pantothenate kinase, partial [Woeseiaceae bacterium]|nr:type III pantothenate kinase [Woeseiaceae bacterium]